MADIVYGKADLAVAIANDVSGNIATVNLPGLLASSKEQFSLAQNSKAYLIFTNPLVASTVGLESSIIVFKNPAASGKSMYLLNVFAINRTSASVLVLKMYLNPTITTPGTAATILPAIMGGAQAASVMTWFIAPGVVISANGTPIMSVSTAFTPPPLSGVPIMSPGANMLITVTPLVATNQTVDISIIWAEY